jgi:hypothetical protein
MKIINKNKTKIAQNTENMVNFKDVKEKLSETIVNSISSELHQYQENNEEFDSWIKTKTNDFLSTLLMDYFSDANRFWMHK